MGLFVPWQSTFTNNRCYKRDQTTFTKLVSLIFKFINVGLKDSLTYIHVP